MIKMNKLKKKRRLLNPQKNIVLKRPWKKVLYENQGFPDNYTDKTFLYELKRNLYIKEVNLYEAILGSSAIVQELTIVIIFVLIYLDLYIETIDPSTIFYISSILTLVGFLTYRLFYSESISKKIGDDVRTVLIFLVFGHLFSPVLHTLTDTISTNTIYTTTFFMMLVHLIFFDYGVSVSVVSNSLSISAAVFGSICLSSRLASAYHAFVLLTVATEMFVLFPLLTKKINKSCTVTIILTSCVISKLYLISVVVLILFLITLLLIHLIFPWLFIKYQSYKDNIYGPWDEAVVNEADNINDLIY